MKIKLAILDHDENYLNRISDAFFAKYSEKIELYTFCEVETAQAALGKSHIDVFLASSSFEKEIDFARIPERCAFNYLVDAPDISALGGKKTICKYQKAENIYLQVLNAFSDNNGEITFSGDKKHGARIVTFSSPCGGTGTSSLAAAYAVRLAETGRKILFLNLETFGSADVFFSGDGQASMDDIIFALKSTRANFPLKVESCARRDNSGVFFYAPVSNPLDMDDITEEETSKLFETLKYASFDDVVVDLGFSLSKKALSVYKQSGAWVWVSDGSENANEKIARAYRAIAALEQSGKVSLTDRLYLAYNKFSNKTGRKLIGIDIRELGGTHKLEHADNLQVVKHLSALSFFDQII